MNSICFLMGSWSWYSLELLENSPTNPQAYKKWKSDINSVLKQKTGNANLELIKKKKSALQETPRILNYPHRPCGPSAWHNAHLLEEPKLSWIPAAQHGVLGNVRTNKSTGLRMRLFLLTVLAWRIRLLKTEFYQPFYTAANLLVPRLKHRG